MVGLAAAKTRTSFSIVRRHTGKPAEPSLRPLLPIVARDQLRATVAATLILGALFIAALTAREPAPFILLGLLAPSAIIGGDMVSRLPEDRAAGFLKVLATAPIARGRLVMMIGGIAALNTLILSAAFVLAARAAGAHEGWTVARSIAIAACLGTWNIAAAASLSFVAQRASAASLIFLTANGLHAASAWTVLAQPDIEGRVLDAVNGMPGGLVATAILSSSTGPLAALALQAFALSATMSLYFAFAWQPVGKSTRALLLSYVVATSASIASTMIAARISPW